MLIMVLFCFARVWASACPGLQKSLTCSFEGGLANLVIVLDDVNRLTSAVDKCGDLLGSLIPVHHSNMVVESFNKNDGLVGCHGISIGKCLVVKCIAPLFKYG
jgi:hypothetical protein